MNSQPERELTGQDDQGGNDTSIEAAAERLLAMESEQDDPEQQEQEAGEAGDPAESSDEPAPESPESKRVKVKVQGEELELELEELAAGYMKGADYSRKTAEAAELRRKAEAELERFQKELAPRVTQLDAALTLLHKELIGDQQELDALIRTNPAEYLTRKHQLDQKAALFQRAYQERQALTAQQEAESRRVWEARAAEESKRLLEKLPAWKDSKKAEAEQRELVEFLTRDLGYTPDEVAQVADHRAILLARDALLYRKQLQAKSQQKATPPPAVKPGAPNPNNAISDREKALQRELKRTGNPEVAAELMLLRSKKK